MLAKESQGMDMEIYVGPLWEKDGVTTLGYRCRPV